VEEGAGNAPGHVWIPSGEPSLSTYEVIVETGFSAAHRLREYEGNCERLHGHNWKVDVTLRAHELDELGIAVDFREAKRLIHEVLEGFDHQFLNELEAFRQVNPTTENLARTICDALAARLPRGLEVARVTAWESDHCGASYLPSPERPPPPG
jgi:6-pyruvoyltetrahydropterin/6-carboxytetrahydropterin synthase